MKNKINTFILIAVIIAFCQCSKDQYPVAQNDRIFVDGNDQDWISPKFQMVDGGKLQCAVARDDNRLYILAKCKGEQNIKKLSLMGLTVWIDGKGKTSQRQGISYPQGIMDDIMMKTIMDRAKGGRQQGDRDRTGAGNIFDNPEMQALLEKNKNNVGLINFYDDSNETYILPLDQLKIPLEASFRRTPDNGIIYELAIPISTIKEFKKNKIGIGFETHTIDLREMMQGMGRGSGTMRPGGMAGRMGGMQGRQMGGGNDERRQQFKELNEPIKGWVTVKM